MAFNRVFTGISEDSTPRAPAEPTDDGWGGETAAAAPPADGTGLSRGTATKGGRLAALSLLAGTGGSPRRFVVVTLAVAAVLVFCVAGVNAVVDPYGTVGTGLMPPVTWTDRSLKVALIERLARAPQVVVLGSSRAMKVEPAFITTKTGRTAFNAAVSSGKPIDAWAFVNLIHDRFPTARSTYLWLLDVEAFRTYPTDPGLLNTPQLAQYLSAGARARTRISQLPSLFSWETSRTAWRVLRRRVRQAASSPAPTAAGGAEFSSDGFRTLDYHDRRVSEGVSLASEIRRTIRQGEETYRDEYKRLSAAAERDFERTLGLMNRLGATPVLVITPMHPTMLADVAPLGWSARHRDVLGYLRSLRPRYRFLLLDFSRVSAFGGSAAAFYDGYHMTVQNTRRLVTTVLADYPHALR